MPFDPTATVSIYNDLLTPFVHALQQGTVDALKSYIHETASEKYGRYALLSAALVFAILDGREIMAESLLAEPIPSRMLILPFMLAAQRKLTNIARNIIMVAEEGFDVVQLMRYLYKFHIEIERDIVQLFCKGRLGIDEVDAFLSQDDETVKRVLVSRLDDCDIHMFAYISARLVASLREPVLADLREELSSRLSMIAQEIPRGLMLKYLDNLRGWNPALGRLIRLVQAKLGVVPREDS